MFHATSLGSGPDILARYQRTSSNVFVLWDGEDLPVAIVRSQDFAWMRETRLSHTISNDLATILQQTS